MLKNENFIDDVFATRFVDVFGSIKESIYVTRVQEIDVNVNQFELISGRLPKKENEALTLGSTLAAICCMNFGLNPLNIGELS